MADKPTSRNVVTVDAAEWTALQRINSAASDLLVATAAVAVKENELRAAREQWRRLYGKAEK